MRILDTPEFRSEAEEADWWASEEGQQKVLAAFEEAAADGTLIRNFGEKHTVRLDLDEVMMAESQAKQCGVEYQTYVKNLLHQALVQQAKGDPHSGVR